jgi:nucleoside-diphosphate-sugar epimerase
MSTASPRRKTVIVTGATGFIGTHVVPRLRRRGDRVIACAILKTAIPGVPVRVGDLTNEASAKRLLHGADVVIHLAGDVNINASIERPRASIDSNVRMMLGVLEAARAMKKKPLIVFASTDRVYGATSKRIVDEREPAVPIEPYTAAKMIAETLLALYHRLYGIPYVVLRFDSVYGPGQPRRMFISDVILKLLERDTIEVGDLSVKKNFVYVGDVADAIVRAAHANRASYGRVYNIGGAHVPLTQVLDRITRVIDAKKGKRSTVLRKKGIGRAKKAEVISFRLSTARARKDLGWRPKTALSDGLQKTIDYFSPSHQ